ncbi:MAG: DNA gyrase inhibitor YacG [Xanthobacteraceae bacterium]|nr:DNA gyrase inhibitor YacG [Xanthobacteraceae bacterium]
MPADPPSANKAAGKPAEAKPCPICGREATARSRPFCSERCRDVDLNRWLSGSYVVPGRDTDPEDAD